ncbi:MAG: LEPR-XLL domain-containing protein [Planctomycetota bacterium]|jgi:hypothetical protein|nr:LEPR-XLL domain-containing protein [Planctomycetota bacterium]
MGTALRQFELEQLEPRILLSGNDLLLDIQPGMEASPDELQKLEVSDAQRAPDVTIAGGKAGEVASSIEHHQDIFSGLDELDLSSGGAGAPPRKRKMALTRACPKNQSGHGNPA